MAKKETKTEFIKRVVRDVRFVLLGSQCGKYHALFENGNGDVAVSYFRGDKKLVTDLSKVSKKDIGIIERDLRKDFN